MEQRIGPTVPPTNAAGVDPAYVPGLLPPRAPAADETVAGKPDAASGKDAASEDAGREAAPATSEAEDADTTADAADTASAPSTAAADGRAGDADEADQDGETAEDDDSPVFEVSDRRGSIRVGRTGVTFRLDSEVAEFGWDEVQAVEIDTPRFGKRFSVTVYTSPRRWFQFDVEAPNRAALKSWAAELDEVLDVHFDDGSEEKAATETEAEAESKADTKAESASGAKPEATTEAAADTTEAADKAGPAADKAADKAPEDAETSA
ncbi:hypothetical protein VSR01_20565 [Actinacidiphila sp. DG2A-62]|uniref:hypothetical protein n=1 Tax=Actinacidiphila sp. DG2A-62 TaxID=3108821 RepID=UPI002DB62B23|nr:hypothetical protein [Actinacidiphila sp. DG2A-62]MEC3995779.1 hypothetical protein [Actinacidiphila sp. DG2A-62]